MTYLLLYVFFGVFVFGTVTAVRIHRELQASHATLGTVTELVPAVDSDPSAARGPWRTSSCAPNSTRSSLSWRHGICTPYAPRRRR